MNVDIWRISDLCRVMQVSRDGYNSWRRRRPSKRSKTNYQLAEEIKRIFAEHKGRYGSPRVWEELADLGYSCSENKVARIMRALELQAIGKKKFRVTTNSNHKKPVADNLLARNFTVTEPGKVYAGDITYIHTTAGWLYLAVVIDLYSRKVVGWSMNENMKTNLVTSAMQMAVKNRKPQNEALFHSDRGVQYAAEMFQEMLEANHITSSMSRKGNCWDNAPSESFFATLKKELIHQEIYSTREEAKLAIFDYIESYYNKKRRHSANGGLSPQMFEDIKLAA